MGGVTTQRIGRPASGPVTDPNFANTVIMMSFDGANNSTTFTDLSFKARGPGSVFGQAKVDTSDVKFGTGAGIFDGSSDLVAWSGTADTDFGSGSFCIESWIKPASIAAGNGCIMGKWDAGALGWWFGRNGANLVFHLSTTGGNDFTQLSGGTLTTAAWYHVAVDFDGTKYRLFLDGVMVNSSTTLRTIFAVGATAVIGIGAWGNLATSWNGRMDELRITKGVSRYGSDSSFTPPAAAFPRS